MDELEETRYPWDSVFGYLGSGDVASIEALHLTLGWLFVLALVARVLSLPRLALPIRLATLYFALTAFTNPAYTVGGLNTNEVFGILAVLAWPVSWRPATLRDASVVTKGLLAVFVVGLAHAIVLAPFHPELIEGARSFTKFAIHAKIAVLALNLMIVGHGLRTGRLHVDTVLRSILAAGTAALLLYAVQGAVLVSGRIPYGTYLDAGFVGVPSFGSVANERGHFGKFMAGYFPFFLYALIAWRWRWRFALLVLVTLANFSSSSQAFFGVFVLLSLWTFRSRIRLAPAVAAMVLTIGVSALLAERVGAAFAGVVTKIYELAFLGDESTGGGRSLETFESYLTHYPLGIGYSGSTLRTAPGLTEINAAHFAFVTQYSLLALPILAAFAWLVWRSVRLARRGSDLDRCLGLGVVMSVVVFASDILWYVPLFWLCFELLRRRPDMARAPGRPFPRTAADPRLARAPSSLSTA